MCLHVRGVPYDFLLWGKIGRRDWLSARLRYLPSTTGGTGAIPLPLPLPSPRGRMLFTLDMRSRRSMPESASNSAGTCAAILVMSPVSLYEPAEPSLPVET